MVSGIKKSTSRNSRKRKKTVSKKVVVLVIDGLADTPQNAEQNGKTPLSEANKPNMDWFAANGACGELLLTPAKSYPKSHIANVALLGYNPRRYYLRRGPLEAVGAGLPYKEGHLALRCNFATVRKDTIGNLTIVDRRAGRANYGLDEIARYINQHVKLARPVNFVFIRTYGHRAVLILKERLSDQISSNDPHAEQAPKKIEALNSSELAKRTAKLVQEFIWASHNLIEYHPKNAERIDRGLLPANYILVREPGNRLVALPNFLRRWRLKRAVCIAENGVIKATCMLAGFNAITVPELSSGTLDFIFDNIDSALAEYDFIYAHIKGVDEAAHDGDFERKLRIIEEIDKRLESFKSFGGILVITCDHITSCKHKQHIPGPVPVLVYGRRKDRVKRFDEFSVKKGLLKRLSGRQLWKYVFGFS